MNPDTTPTPRTDAVMLSSNWPYHITSEMQKLERELTEKTNEVERLRDAAQAVVDRWETPLWKDAEPTASVIYRLRNALAPAPKQEESQIDRNLDMLDPYRKGRMHPDNEREYIWETIKLLRDEITKLKEAR